MRSQTVKECKSPQYRLADLDQVNVVRSCDKKRSVETQVEVNEMCRRLVRKPKECMVRDGRLW